MARARGGKKKYSWVGGRGGRYDATGGEERLTQPLVEEEALVVPQRAEERCEGICVAHTATEHVVGCEESAGGGGAGEGEERGKVGSQQQRGAGHAQVFTDNVVVAQLAQRVQQRPQIRTTVRVLSPFHTQVVWLSLRVTCRSHRTTKQNRQYPRDKQLQRRQRRVLRRLHFPLGRFGEGNGETEFEASPAETLLGAGEEGIPAGERGDGVSVGSEGDSAGMEGVVGNGDRGDGGLLAAEETGEVVGRFTETVGAVERGGSGGGGGRFTAGGRGLDGEEGVVEGGGMGGGGRFAGNGVEEGACGVDGLYGVDRLHGVDGLHGIHGIHRLYGFNGTDGLHRINRLHRLHRPTRFHTTLALSRGHHV